MKEAGACRSRTLCLQSTAPARACFFHLACFLKDTVYFLHILAEVRLFVMAVSRVGNGNGNRNNRAETIDTGQVLAASRLPVVSLQALVMRGLVSNSGPANGRIRALRARNAIATRPDPTDRNSAAFAQVLQLFLNEPERENETWAQAQSWQLPDTVAASAWLNTYSRLYGFDASMRQIIAGGLPWAKRR
jgi:hypothetical protein